MLGGTAHSVPGVPYKWHGSAPGPRPAAEQGEGGAGAGAGAGAGDRSCGSSTAPPQHITFWTRHIDLESCNPPLL